MSHFSVMVIGSNPEEQLAPYHEFECTGVNDEYVEDFDITEEVLKRVADGESEVDALSYYGLEKCVFDSEEAALSEIEDNGKAKYGYVVIIDKKIVKVVNRTNPNRKWDWYVLGGRWDGMLKGLDGAIGDKANQVGWFNQLEKSDIDLIGMQNEKEKLARKEYAEFTSIVNGREIPNFKELVIKYGTDNINRARNEYNNSQVVKDLQAAEFYFFGDTPQSRYGDDVESYVKEQVAAALVPFALIHNGEWVERGKMGWFGCASDEVDMDKWQTSFMEMFNALPDDTLISIYDCHI